MSPENADSVGLAWSVKSSFVNYVENLSDGRVEVSAGSERREDGTFFFPLSMTRIAGPGEFRFDGSVRFVGHFGMISLLIANPHIVQLPDRVVLMIDGDGDGPPYVFVTLSDPLEQGDGIRYRGVTLTREGADLFFDNYRSGAHFDPLTVRQASPASLSAG